MYNYSFSLYSTTKSTISKMDIYKNYAFDAKHYKKAWPSSHVLSWKPDFLNYTLYITLCCSHLRLWNLQVKIILRTVQSANIPIQTPIGPKPMTLIRNTQRQNLHAHIVQQDVIMENFTSPAARSPYPGTNAMVHTSGFMIVIHITIWKHISALSFSMPPRIVTGFVSANTIRQLVSTTISAITQSFFM